jgi:hypothetical protein
MSICKVISLFGGEHEYFNHSEVLTFYHSEVLAILRNPTYKKSAMVLGGETKVLVQV